jgi:predicted RNA-binding Zn ribbon-like protein
MGEPFVLIGGLLWLDLVNTEPLRDGQRVDLLPGFSAVVRWLGAAGALSGAGARRALRRWEGTPDGERVWREARALRAALRVGAERMAAGKPAGGGMVRAVNRVLAARPAVTRLVRSGRGYVTREEPLGDSAMHLLAPVAASAAWLLAQGDPALVRRCGGEACVLHFYDGTKNRTRRWCSMDGCGSRAKAAAYYRRRRASGR